MVLWCPDWPVTASGADPHTPVAVLAGNQVLACSESARAQGVRRGLRRREAQGRCPELTVVEHDPARDARAFEPIVAAVEAMAPGVEVLRPGVCAWQARGPASFHGSEAAAAEAIIEQVAAGTGAEALVGIADGVFAAQLAARSGRIIPPGRSAEFLEPADVGLIDRPVLVDLLRRLGLRTLGAFARLPAGDVLTRFGTDAALAHAQAGGQDERRLAIRVPPEDLTVSETFDEPLARVDIAAFAAKALAARLHETLSARGLAATRLGVAARMSGGEELYRVWRHDGLLTADAIADRARWQLDGWLSRRGPSTQEDETGGVTHLSLVPDGLLAQAALQPGLWGEAGEGRDRAHRAASRVQGLLGPEAVLTPVPGGGRDLAERVRWVPWGDERVPLASADQPWPGAIPGPYPAAVLPEPVPAQVLDAAGRPVTVSGRHELSAPPARVAGVPVAAWAGPWPVDARWWTVTEASRRVRFQVVLADGRALLLVLSGGGWRVEARYE
ncbi:DNA polymerase Y family protein [Longispora albida]|uniref:DNA polymerase Y family protein n=1 Tax=Longispora albida TaxID=203523 RepID=UPI00035D371F|nr:DNA polymerase Y family protein [Longispora albida]